MYTLSHSYASDCLWPIVPIRQTPANGRNQPVAVFRFRPKAVSRLVKLDCRLQSLSHFHLEHGTNFSCAASGVTRFLAMSDARRLKAAGHDCQLTRPNHGIESTPVIQNVQPASPFVYDAFHPSTNTVDIWDVVATCAGWLPVALAVQIIQR